MAKKVPIPSTLSLAAFFVRIATAAVYRALTYPIRRLTNSPRAPTFTKDVFFAAVRAGCDVVQIAHSRYLMPSTTDLYHQFCAANKIAPRSLEVSLPDSKDVVAAHWIGEPDADVVVLYFHGGGYTQAGTEGYLRFWTQTVKDLNTGSRIMAVLQLAYSLAPEAQYPRQLQESAAVLAHLIAAERSPSSIILAGDSAGGNMVLSLLSHVLHPHPSGDVARIELNQEKIGGALMISPWVTFSQEHESFTNNRGKDMLSPRQLRRYAGMFLAPSSNPETDPGRVHGDAYTEPLHNDPSWWKGLPRVVSEVLVWSGGNELFADAIADFEWVFREGWCQGGDEDGGDECENVVFVQSPERAHIEPILSVMLEQGVKGKHQTVIEEWMKARLEKSG
ncbi:alpha/beta-hydrolase [Paraphaeosphaeria sporulosa]|uniref:Alpha/beta-hydrolase n=1 Tax=Paraphaeosphaeria sporulosa TaxID=1460663 RepID=A0A177CIW7_9PLEO|nr:alpha/beta-hydrolase [Paraphaeosphaeria sporulosa]OAG07464.1 alpha/beta-hydrolase [Paraphaeosphaeria sporulosa]